MLCSRKYRIKSKSQSCLCVVSAEKMSPQSKRPRRKRTGTSRNSSEPVSQFEEDEAQLELFPRVDPRAEARRKKVEDLRFSITGSWPIYKEGLDKRKIIEEKMLSENGLKEHYLHVLDNIQKRGREFFTESPGEYNETLVREFYGAYAASKTKNQAKHHSYLTSITVRGVAVSCGPKSTNEFYFGTWEHGAIEYNAKMANKKDGCAWVASIVAQGTSAWIVPHQKTHKRDFTQES